jgi:hypothetical protein
MCKTRIFDAATEVAAANGLADSTYFQGKPERFHSYLESHWPKIREQCEEDGVFIEFGHGLPGIRRAGKVGLRKTASWSSTLVESQADRYNRTVDNAQPILPLPAIQLKVLMP